MVRGRFAPSPSGRMHLGNVFTALLACTQANAAFCAHPFKLL